jgi:hypothetical protein
MAQYRYRKSTPITSKLHLEDSTFYATILDNGDSLINILLTKYPIDPSVSPDYSFETNHNLIAITTGVIDREEIGELLLDSSLGDAEVTKLNINWVSSSPYYSGNRFGVFIMYLLVAYSIQKYGIQYVTLDDDTDVKPINVDYEMGKVDNIYYLIGFKHRGKIGNQEYWKTWYPSNVINDPARIITAGDFMASKEIVSIQNKFMPF